MCGICGVVQIGGSPREVIAAGALARMTDVMTHRGPNDRGTYSAPGIALGVRRLSIIDVEGGHQPFANEDESIWAIQNGELYNHESVRANLSRAGHRFRSRCDTEILPHLYEQKREGLPAALHGKFAIAVWDGSRRRALLARDRLGVKPLYYAVVGDLVIFASELKAILASGLVEPRLDFDAIDAYLTLGYFACPSTPFELVRKLPPGCSLIIDESVREVAYWDFPQAQPDAALTESAAAEELLAELEEAVRLRLMSDVPLGAMLSGGIDSSLLVALMARNMSQPVETFSVGFVEDGVSSELGDAELVANALGARHHELILSAAESSVALEDLVWALDEPLSDLSALGFMALSELAAQHVTVAIAGQGSDELFGGYSRHRRAAIIERADRLPRLVVDSASSGLRLAGGRYERFAHALVSRDMAERYLSLRTPLLDDTLRAELVRPPLRPDNVSARRVIEQHSASFSGGALAATLSLDAQLGLVDDMLHYSDRVSMAHSLEVRVPFLDHRVVEFAARIPASLKVHRGTTKYLVKEIARGLIPERIIDKPKTGFFNRAVETWMHAQLKGRAGDYLLAAEPASASLLDYTRISRLVSSPRGQTRRESETLLAILMLEVWLSSFVPRALAVANGSSVSEKSWVRSEPM